MCAATLAPPATSSEPPSQKSFCTSAMIRARATVDSSISDQRHVVGTAPNRSGCVPGRKDGDRDRGVAGRELQPFPRYGDECGTQVLARLGQRHLVHRGAGDHVRALQRPVTRLLLGRAARRDDFFGGGTARLVTAYR